MVAVTGLNGRVFILFPAASVLETLLRRFEGAGVMAAVYGASPGSERFDRIGTAPPPPPGAVGRPRLGVVDAFLAAVLRQVDELATVPPANLRGRLLELEYRFNHRKDDLLAAIWRRVVR